MKPGHGAFAVKLRELEREYGQLQSRLRICLEKDHQEIVQEMQKIKDENTERDLLLEKMITSSQSPGVSELADAQLNYRRKVGQGLNRAIDESPNLEDCAEQMALYAEYAIDFATQAMRHALLSTFAAVDFQLSLEEKRADLQKNITAQEGINHA